MQAITEPPGLPLEAKSTAGAVSGHLAEQSQLPGRCIIPTERFRIDTCRRAVRQPGEQVPHSAGTRTTSGLPEISAATTGVPQAIDSSRTFAQPSRDDASTEASAAPYNAGSSACGRAPSNRTRPPRPC